jgi:hypothetical protein
MVTLQKESMKEGKMLPQGGDIMKDYMVTTYVEIDNSKMTKMEGFKLGEYNVCQAIERVRLDNGDFSLINIKIDEKRRHFIVASNVCVVKEASVYEEMKIPPELSALPNKEMIAWLNAKHATTLKEENAVIVGLHGSCRPFKINNIWK